MPAMLPALLSLIVPGSGQFLLGERGRGIGFFVTIRHPGWADRLAGDPGAPGPPGLHLAVGRLGCLPPGHRDRRAAWARRSSLAVSDRLWPGLRCHRGQSRHAWSRAGRACSPTSRRWSSRNCWSTPPRTWSAPHPSRCPVSSLCPSRARYPSDDPRLRDGRPLCRRWRHGRARRARVFSPILRVNCGG